MHKNILLIITVLFVCTISVGCSSNEKRLSTDVPKIEDKEYGEQDFEKNIDICINYPQIVNEQKISNQSEINKLLHDYFKVEAKDGLYYYSNYEIKMLTSEIISIVKKAESYIKGSPYPSTEFGAININIRTASALKFDDILSDEMLLSAVDENEVSSFNGVNGLLAVHSYEALIDMFLNQIERVYYITDSGIGIIIYLNHTSGDYVLLEIPLALKLGK